MTTDTTTGMAERGGTNTAVATWEGDWLCSVEAGGFRLVVDEPVEFGGSGLGPMPTDLLLASLSSCYALALAWAARKRDVRLPDLRVTATGRYVGQKFGELVLTVETSLGADEVAPLLEPARKVCYVSNTFANIPDVHVELAPDRMIAGK